MQSKTNSSKACDILPDELNRFYARFEKPENPTVKTSLTQHAISLFKPITEYQVRLQLKQMDTCYSSGPKKIYPAVLKYCADQLAVIVIMLFNIVIDERKTPIILKTSVIKPIPKISKPKASKGYRCYQMSSL